MPKPAAEAANAAYQGAPGAFSEDAARELLGPGARLRPCVTLNDVVRALVGGVVDAAVVPIENTLAGAVPGAADLIARHPVRIVAEHVQPIVHSLVAAPGARLRGVRRVWSHPVALAQCERWFRSHRRVSPVSAFDTAGAAADVIRRGAKDEAAIASRRAAEVYGGVILADALQDESDNFTRFVLLRRRSRGIGLPRTIAWPIKASVVCVLKNRPGALARALQPFADAGLNLSRIESRPIPDSPFDYQFHLDVGPTTDAEALRNSLSALIKHSRSVRVLGTYAPAAVVTGRRAVRAVSPAAQA